MTIHLTFRTHRLACGTLHVPKIRAYAPVLTRLDGTKVMIDRTFASVIIRKYAMGVR